MVCRWISLQLLLGHVQATRTTSRFTIPVHSKLADEACRVIDKETPEVQLTCDDGMLQKGIVWPDCPTVPEKDDLSNSCRSIGGSEVGVHTGLMEMAKQGATQAYWKQKDKWNKKNPNKLPDPEQGETRENGMSNYRLFQQHWHGSPPPPLDVQDGQLVDNNPWHAQDQQYAVVTNVDLRNKMLEQLGLWYCKSMSLARASSQKRRTEGSCPAHREAIEVGVDELNCGESKYAWKLSRFELGKMLHTVTDSFSRSHVRRHFCPGTGLSYQQATGECIPVDPGDAHDAAVDVWNSYRNHDAKATSLLQAKAKADKSSNQPVQVKSVHTILHQRHRTKRIHREKPVKGYMEAPDRMTDGFQGPEESNLGTAPMDQAKNFSHMDDEMALRSARIQQFYSMDDTDWPKHGGADSVTDDWRFDLAGAASRLVVREFARYVKLQEESSVDFDDNWKSDDKSIETESLHRMLRLLCDQIFPMDEETAAIGAGGSDSRLALNKVTWYPAHVLTVDEAKAYFKKRGVLQDFPLGQGDACDLVNFADYSRPIEHRGDMELPEDQTSLGFGSCDALLSKPVVLFPKDRDKDDDPDQSGCVRWYVSPFVLVLSLLAAPKILSAQ